MYTIFDITTGEIHTMAASIINGSPQAPPGYGIIEGTVGHPPIDYVVDGVVVPRPAFNLPNHIFDITADGVDTAVIAGVPAGWEAFTPDGATAGLTDGADILVTALDPGEHVVAFRLFPYADIRVMVNATAVI